MDESQVFVGRQREFSLRNDWSIFKPRLENFFLANAILDLERKRAILLNSYDEEAYKLAINLSIPDKPENKTYDQLISLFDKHFLPRESTFAARYKFYNAARETGESVNDWLARLRFLAGNCKFGITIDNCVLDRFVIGIGKGNVRDRLFEEDATKLTIDRAVEIATSREAASTQYYLDVPDVRVKKEPVFFMKNKFRQGKLGEPRRNKYCEVCGNNNHESDKCRYISYTCLKCAKVGHLARVCRRQGIDEKGAKNGQPMKARQVKTHFVSENDQVSDEESLFHIELMEGGVNVNSGSSYKVTLGIEGVNIIMEMDTGCKRTVIPLSTFKRKFPKVTLRETNLTFVSYFANKEKPVGVFTCDVTHNNKLYKNMELFVVKSQGPPLFGRIWFEKMGYCIINTHVDSKNSQSVYFTKDNANDLMSELMTTFPKVFTEKLGKFNKDKIKLELLPDAKPKFMKSRPVPYALLDKVNAEIDRLVNEGILESIDYSPYASPIVPVLKKDGIRIAGDYKLTLNPYIKIDQHPLPKVQDLFQKVQGCTIFAKLDLSHAYQQLELEEESRQLVTINTPKGLFRYTRMPYGVACAPAKFQKIIDNLLEGMEGTSALLDDILIGGKDVNELKQRLTKVLKRLEEAGLTLRIKKCEIEKKSLEYLGYRIDSNGLHTTDEKVKAILEAPRPKNIKELQSCLGFINFLTKFLPSLSAILSPLYRLLKKNTPWNWDERCHMAYETVKRVVKENRSLAHYNPDLPIRLSVDGSDFGLGAIISQKDINGVERPLAFASRTLTKAEEGYSQLHKEGASLIFGVKKFHVYLFGRRWILANDNKPLLAIFGPKKGIPLCAANRLQRWALLLSNYSYDIEWVKSGNNIADWLSRAPSAKETISEETNDLTIKYVFDDNIDLPIDYKMVLASSKKDKQITKVIAYLKMGWPDKYDIVLLPFFRKREELHVERDILMWGYRIVIPKNLRVHILKELHMSHMGMSKVKALARSYVWWPKIDSDIEKAVQTCSSCNVNKDNPQRTTLIPWEWPQRPWQRIHIDYLGPLEGNYYLVLVDGHSKWIEAFATKSMTSRITIKILRTLFARFGLPEVLVSDNFSAFSSEEFQEFLKRNGITYKSGAPFSPRTNGAAENSVKTIKRSLHTALTEVAPESLDVALQRFLLDYRNTPHTITGISPAQAIFGRQLRTRLDLLRPPQSLDLVQKKQMKQIENAGGCGVEKKGVQIEDDVWVKNYRKGEDKWLEARVVKVMGPRRVKVFVPKLNLTWMRHVDQTRKNYSRLGDQEEERNVNSNAELDPKFPSRERYEEADMAEQTGMELEKEGLLVSVPKEGQGEDILCSKRTKKPVKRLIEEC